MAMSTNTFVLTTLERGINRMLALDTHSAERLAPLNERQLGLRLTDPELALRVTFHVEGITLSPDDTIMEDCDVVLETTLAGLTGLALSRGQRSRDVAFRGDIGTIQEVRTLFAELDIDWQQQLARLMGETSAERVSAGMKAGQEWGQRSMETLMRNAAELATEERQWLPTRAEVRHFLADVDAMREDVDRIEARLQRLERRGERS